MVKDKRCNFIISTKSDKAKFLIFTLFSIAIILSVQFVVAAGPATVNLGTAGDFVILSKAGITNVPTSSIIGNVGTTPITGAAIGVSCAEVTGTIYSVDGAGPLPCRVTNAALLNTARINMEAAYTDAAGRTGGSPIGGNIGGMTLGPGVYTTTSNLIIPTDVILSGNSTDVWIFQVGGTLSISSAKKVILSGGAQANNIFWQVSGVTTIGTYSVFNGNILDQTKIAMQTGAALCGRTLAQTEVTLDHNYISNICGNNINETNTTNLAYLTVKKMVNGGTKNVSDFILLINGYSVLSGIPNVVAPGSYVVSEIGVLGYNGIISGDCSPNGAVTLTTGQNKTCIITNNYVPLLPNSSANLTINKIVINDNGGIKSVSDFILLVNGNLVSSGIPNVVAPGSYVVSEFLDPLYNRSFSGACSIDGTVLLNTGDVKTCIITNNDIQRTTKSIPVMDYKLFILLTVFVLILGFYGIKKYGR